ncbi:hypothetical protein RRF57_010773 [Xylaria bambusicola]|uniref:Uncharacterized protein n=1 Tax=Xylaria bambusicola TaxID=326684 RepID=A0AAN7ZCR9_9PEZI
MPHTPIMVPSQGQRPHLGDFSNRNQLRGPSLNINLSNQAREDLIRYRGGIPNRRPSRFSHEYRIDPDNLESAIIKFMQSCHCDTVSKLVFIGFEMRAE